MFDASSVSITNPFDKSTKYSPNRQGFPVAISGISPIAAVFSSLITSLSITSLAFTRELVFGNEFVAGEDNTGPATELVQNIRIPFVSAIYVLCEILTTGIRTLLNIKGGGCGIGGYNPKGIIIFVIL